MTPIVVVLEVKLPVEFNEQAEALGGRGEKLLFGLLGNPRAAR
jgi:hypothetical protein